jgi:hypothetical protein
VPETFPADLGEAEQIRKMIEDQTLLGRAATLDDAARLRGLVPGLRTGWEAAG